MTTKALLLAVSGLCLLTACDRENPETSGFGEGAQGTESLRETERYQRGALAPLPGVVATNETPLDLGGQGPIQGQAGSGLGRYGSGVDVAAPGAAPPPGETQDFPPPVGPSELPDVALALRISRVISQGNLVGAGTLSAMTMRNVHVTATNGVVTLRGAVPRVEEKELVEANVRRISGVRAVRNELTVVPAAPSR